MSSYSAPKTAVIHAILFMIASMACFSMMNICIRYASFDMHTTQIVFLRNLFAILLLLPWVCRQGVSSLHTEHGWKHFWRGTIGVLGMQTWFYCIAVMPLNEATALSFTAPIFTTLFAILFLGERAGMHRWGAVLCGFIGSMIIIRPDSGNIDENAFAVLFATSMWAIAGMLVKSLTATEPPNRIVFYMSLFMALWSLPAAIWFWQTPDIEMLALILAVAITSTVAHLCLVNAYARSDITILTPFEFFRLIFTAILAYIAFHETADIWTWLGGAVIVASTAYIARREALAKQLK